MSTGYQGEFEALAGAFETGWGSKSPVAWPNLDFTPPDPMSGWARFTVLPGESFHAAIGRPGANIIRHPGLIVIQIFTPINNGSISALDWADDAAGIFRNYRSGGIRCGTPWLNVVAVSETEGWNQVNVNVPFVRDEAM